jgi:hypothetical protein
MSSPPGQDDIQAYACFRRDMNGGSSCAPLPRKPFHVIFVKELLVKIEKDRMISP